MLGLLRKALLTMQYSPVTFHFFRPNRFITPLTCSCPTASWAFGVCSWWRLWKIIVLGFPQWFVLSKVYARCAFQEHMHKLCLSWPKIYLPLLYWPRAFQEDAQEGDNGGLVSAPAGWGCWSSHTNLYTVAGSKTSWIKMNQLLYGSQLTVKLNSCILSLAYVVNLCLSLPS